MQKQEIQITYPYPEAKPPVFVAGDFTDPPWEPQELSDEETEGGGFRFSKTFEIANGKWQYKFRLGLEGPEEYWVCDKDTDIVKDEDGNENSLLHVQNDHNQTAWDPNGVHPCLISHVCKVEENGSATDHQSLDSSTLDKYLATPESICVSEDSNTDILDNKFNDRKISTEDVDKISQLISKKAVTADQVDLDEVKPKLFVDAGLANTLTQSSAPLLSHECLTSLDTPEYSNLTWLNGKAFRHSVHETSNNTAQDTTSINELNDPSLETFPSERHKILERIAAIYKEIPEDDTIDDDSLISSVSPMLSTGHSPAFSHEYFAHLPSPSYLKLEKDSSLDREPLTWNMKDQAVPYTNTDIDSGMGSACGSPHSLAGLENFDGYTHLPLLKCKEFPTPENKAPASTTEYVGKLRIRSQGSKDLDTAQPALDSPDLPKEETSRFYDALKMVVWWLESVFLALFGPFAEKE